MALNNLQKYRAAMQHATALSDNHRRKEYQEKITNEELILWIKTKRNIDREEMKIQFSLLYSDLCVALDWEFAEANWDVIFPKKYFQTPGFKLMTL